MTFEQNTTPRTTRTIVTAKSKVTVTLAGQVGCNCASFRAAVALFGEGYCSHVRQARAASDDDDLNPTQRRNLWRDASPLYNRGDEEVDALAD